MPHAWTETGSAPAVRCLVMRCCFSTMIAFGEPVRRGQAYLAWGPWGLGAWEPTWTWSAVSGLEADP